MTTIYTNPSEAGGPFQESNYTVSIDKVFQFANSTQDPKILDEYLSSLSDDVLGSLLTGGNDPLHIAKESNSILYLRILCVT